METTPNKQRTILVALYRDIDTARDAIADLVDSGFDRSRINLVANDVNGRYARYLNIDRVLDTPPDDTFDDDEDVKAGEGAGFGAVIGALVGLGTALIPGVGPVLAAGPLVAAIYAGVGAASGAVTGGITASLVSFGTPSADADVYAEVLRRGGTLVVLDTENGWTPRARNILNDHDPLDVGETERSYRSSGWTGYDPDAAPLTHEQFDMEQSRYTSAGAEEGDRPEDRAYTREAVTDSSTGGSMPTGAVAEGSDRTPPTDRVRSYDWAGAARPFDSYTSDFRTHYDTAYGTTGFSYEQVLPAYQYGYWLAVSPQYRGYSWEQIEPDAQRIWSRRHEGAWSAFRDAVRSAWERTTNNA